MRKVPTLTQKRPAGRPMANGGIKRQTKRIRKQVKIALKMGAIDVKNPLASVACSSYGLVLLQRSSTAYITTGGFIVTCLSYYYSYIIA